MPKYTDIFCWKNERSFCTAKAYHIFQQKILECKSFFHFFNKKYWHISDINIWNLNETLTNDVVSFEQLPLVYMENYSTLTTFDSWFQDATQSQSEVPYTS